MKQWYVFSKFLSVLYKRRIFLFGGLELFSLSEFDLIRHNWDWAEIRKKKWNSRWISKITLYSGKLILRYFEMQWSKPGKGHSIKNNVNSLKTAICKPIIFKFLQWAMQPQKFAQLGNTIETRHRETVTEIQKHKYFTVRVIHIGSSLFLCEVLRNENCLDCQCKKSTQLKM